MRSSFPNLEELVETLDLKHGLHMYMIKHGLHMYMIFDDGGSLNCCSMGKKWSFSLCFWISNYLELLIKFCYYFIIVLFWA